MLTFAMELVLTLQMNYWRCSKHSKTLRYQDVRILVSDHYFNSFIVLIDPLH